MKRFFRIVIGIFCLILGVIGLFFPILQGILFIIIGLLVLAPESKRIRQLLARFRLKYPGVFEKAEQMKHKYTRKSNKPEPPESPTGEPTA
ncbi:MAG: PGPGW domain-containing protein [Candidatus Latescibacter sp.]|nr:PGPGW domain-containing protein [Candidatus Latescibacter sp.]